MEAILERKLSLSESIISDLASRKILIPGLILLVLAIYASSLSGNFIYDDYNVVLANPLLGHWDPSTLTAIFTRDYWAAYNSGHVVNQIESLYYRPFIHMYELVVYELVGRSALGWHLISIALHALATIL